MNESYTIHRIHNQLLNKGWIIEGADRNVYLEGECKTAEQKEKLQRKRTDVILYRSNSTQALAIIEAKKPRNKLDDALEQGLDYAKRIGARFVFASDSYVTRLIDVNGNVPTIDGVPIHEIVNEKRLLELHDTIHITTRKEIIKSRRELISIFNNAQKLLRRDGIDAGMESIYEFCTLLFIKIMSETSDKIPTFYRWGKLIEFRGGDLLAHYRATIQEFKKHYEDIFREMKIKSPEVLEGLVTSLKNIDLSSIDIDIKGEAYEHFLRRYSTANKSVLGQHFTPRHITDMMALLLDPKTDEKTYDPFCGTGGMLLSCYKHMRQNVYEEAEIQKLNEECLFGSDLSYGTSQIAKMNMVLIGDGHSNIKNEDSLRSTLRGEYNNAITNIPFNVDINNWSKVPMNSNEACIRRCMESLAPGGRACIVVPENLAYDSQHKDIRKFIVENSTIEAVIRLPRHTFSSYTAARTCVLWLSKIWKSRSENFVYINVENDGFSDSAWKEPIKGSEIPKILENKDTLGTTYGRENFAEHYEFFNSTEGFVTEGEYSLGDLLEVKTTKQPIIPDTEYSEPTLNSHSNTISTRGEPRIGNNIAKKSAIMIEPGDLVIGTLHTQRGNGLFAISDGYYIATSQLVGTIKTNLISPEWLKVQLQNILPKLEVNDLVGRETFSKKFLLSLRIPKEPPEFENDLKKIESLESTKKEADISIKSILEKYTL